MTKQVIKISKKRFIENIVKRQEQFRYRECKHKKVNIISPSGNPKKKINTVKTQFFSWQVNKDENILHVCQA